ncbi:MAG: amino acid adenylation domain-containing protein [Pseudomonas sp.]|uniref:non-ribosomal peptide synthetase n=1 Tax=Pseudomonas sp. TaxID=306 RepID=UPI002733AA08|nr:non-ribosomal peptide synthetase [Pseudomonas sp.]MDP3846052.1 amino acid adenylation domain-containing protein [Pseudomonas sp.]
MSIEGFRPALQQTRHWRLHSAAHDVAQLCAELPAAVDSQRLHAALGQLLARHEILRTRLTAVPGMQLPVQVIADQLDFSWQVLEVGEQDAQALQARLQAELASCVQSAEQPPLAAALLRSGPSSRLLLALPRVNADAATLERLLQELAALYQGQPLGDEPVQYADFAEWQHELATGTDGDAGRVFWQRQQATELLGLAHPFQRTRSESAYRPARVVQSLSATAQDCLQSALAGLAVQPATVFGLCWAALLQRHLGLPRLLLGWCHDGRNDATQTAFGPYAKALPLLLAIDEGKSLAALIGEFEPVLAEAEAWQESWPGDAVAPSCGFRYGASPAATWPLLTLQAGGEAFALLLDIQERNGQFAFALDYDQTHFDEPAARLILAQFLALCEQACAASRRPLREANGIGAQQAEWLVALNQTTVAIAAPALLHQLFEAQAEANPSAIALSHGGHQLSYAELERQANRLAHRLRHAGLCAGQPVGLFLGRSSEAIIAILAILKAGGAYLPLDPAYPSERLADMLAQTQAPLLLSVTALSDSLPAGDYRCIWLDAEDDADLPEQRPASIGHPDQLAYLIFTSGSTGRPKGVMVSHRNAVHSTSARWLGYEEPLESFLLVSGLAFDSSVAGLFWTLSQGGTLCLPDNEQVQDALALGRLIAEQRISHCLMLPSLYAQVLEQAGAQLASLRCAIVAGEACQALVAARHHEVCPAAALYNEYGPTEGSVWCSLYRSTGAEQGVLPIGRAIANMQVRVLDQQLEVVAPGVAGEIYLAGSGITQGYLGRPDLTAERFLPDPFGAPGSRLYRSGDIGRLNARGDLEFLGRTDHQVKIRGFRIELGEIEARLLLHPAIREAAVLARESSVGDAELVAYLVCRAACPDAQALRQHLAEQLPEHMLPSAYLMLPALPLTPNGKLDRAALPAPQRSSERAYRAPRNEREMLLAELWAEVLGVERIGLDDHFFELGGHSLTATRLISRLRSALGLEVPVRALFQHPSFAAFAEQALPNAIAPSLPSVVPTAREGTLALSYSQERLWLFDRLHPGKPTYNVAEAVQLSGELDQPALERSFAELLRRHASLRTTFVLLDGQPQQRIAPPRPFPLPLLDLSGLSQAERDEALRHELDALALQPFDLARGPLVRAGLIRLEAQTHVLWLCLHHIVTDGWSMRVLTRELTALYSAFSTGQPAPLSEPVLQYADFAHWQRRQLGADVLKAQLDFWLAHLGKERPLLHLPGMRPRPALPSHRGAQHHFSLDSELTQALHELTQQKGVTLFSTLLTAFKLLLAGHSGQHDIRVGIPIANRNQQALEGLIGFFVNTLALRTDLAGNPSFEALLLQLHDNMLAAHDNQDLPFEQLLQALPNTQQQSVPLLQVMFDLHRERILTSSEFGNLQISPMEEGSNHSTLFDLMLDIGEREHGLVATFTYSTDLFEPDHIALLAEDYRQLLRNVLQQPQASLQQLSDQLSQPPQASQRSALKAQTQIYALLEELLEQPALDPQASFFEQGGTSLKAVLLCARLQQQWGTAIPPQLVFLHPQLTELVRVLKPYAGGMAR